MEELKDKILSWIKTQGYPLEMECHRLFKSNGFTCSASPLYVDVEEGRRREIDLFAIKVHPTKLRFEMGVSLLVECKYTKSRPWVAFCHKDDPTVQLPHRGFFYTNYLEQVFARLRKQNHWREKAKKFDFLFPEYIGSGVVEAFRPEGGEDFHSYKAMMSATKAAVYSIKRMNERNLLPSKKIPICRITIPVVVVEGDLFCSLMSENGDIKVYEASHIPVFTPSRYEEVEGFPIVQIVKRQELPAFLTSINEFIQFLFDSVSLEQKDIEELVLSLFKKDREPSGPTTPLL